MVIQTPPPTEGTETVGDGASPHPCGELGSGLRRSEFMPRFLIQEILKVKQRLKRFLKITIHGGGLLHKNIFGWYEDNVWVERGYKAITSP